MPDEQDPGQQVDPQGGQDGGDGGAAADTGAGGIRARLPLIGGAIAGLGLGAAAGLLVLGPRLAPATARAQSVARTAESSRRGDGKNSEAGKSAEAGKSEAAPVYMIDNLVLNPAGSGGTRFLLLSVALQVKDESGMALLKGHDAELRDMILRLFGGKTAEQVTEVPQRDGLRAELLGAVNRIIPAGVVRGVFFPQFVVQ